MRRSCTATFTYDDAAGWRDLIVQYFDTNTGVSRFRVRVGNQIVDEWTAADHVPTRKIDGSSSARRVITGLALRPGDTISIEGIPDGAETAALDYVEIRSGSRVRGSRFGVRRRSDASRLARRPAQLELDQRVQR